MPVHDGWEFEMSSTLGRRASLFAAATALCWAGFAATGGAAYADPGTHNSQSGNSAAAHDNNHGKDDAKNTDASKPGSSDHSSGNAGTSGDATQPQPTSNADQNSGGANGQCPGGTYCSTRDGSPSGNGNGNGEATGKPCAGCVGKADNKNPKGQQPGGSDNNAGYECDRNHGIGRSNPAHTGCQTGPSSSTPPPSCSGDNCGSIDGSSSTTPPPPCSGDNCGSDNDSTSATCVGGTMIDGACVSGSTLHRDPSQAGADVSALHASRVPAFAAAALGTTVSAAALPFTGGEISLLVDAGIALLLIGSACVVAGRRRRTTA
jgi:hypothetical protein